MIIYGTRTLHSTKGTGVFNCPRCGVQQAYTLKSADNYFTLYFIPLIPLGSAGQYVSCSACGDTYDTQILSYDPVAEEMELFASIERLLVVFMIETGYTEISNVESLRMVLEDFFDTAVDQEQILNELRLASEAGVDVENFILREMLDLTEKGKILVVCAAARVITTGNQLTEQAKQLLRELGNNLSADSQTLEGLLADPQTLFGE